MSALTGTQSRMQSPPPQIRPLQQSEDMVQLSSAF